MYSRAAPKKEKRLVLRELDSKDGKGEEGKGEEEGDLRAPRLLPCKTRFHIDDQ